MSSSSESLNHSINIENEILQILNEEYKNEESLINHLKALNNRNNHEIYSHLFRILVNLEIPADQARDSWDKIIQHWNNFSRLLGKQFSFRAAMLDYFINENKMLANPKIIEIKIYENIINSALQDLLTGVYNRRYYEQIFQNEINRASRKKSVISLCVLDIDDFKHFNDTYGHREGDRVLTIFASVIKKSLRREDIVCRYGGEEFVVIMPDALAENSCVVMQRISEDMKKEKFFDDLQVTFSCGIACFPNDSNNKEELFIKADKAMYTAKINGKDQICIYGRERRTKLRFAVNWDISFSVIDENYNKLPEENFTISHTYDISLEGLCFITNTIIPVGTRLKVIFHDQNQMNFQNKNAKVVWVSHLNERENKVGLKFL